MLLFSVLIGECYNTLMKKKEIVQAPELLFGFVLRARLLIVGRDNLFRGKSHLQFVLITRDISPNSLEKLLWDFRHYPVVQNYSAEDLEKFFGIKGAKVIGFKKSGLAQSLYTSLKEHRINQPIS
jgi:hypothetical protein